MSLQYLAHIESNSVGKGDSIGCLHWLEEGIILGGTKRGELHAWNAQTGQHYGKSKRRAHGFDVYSISSSPHNKIVLTQALDGTVALWDTSNVSASLESTTFNDEESMSDENKKTIFPLRYIQSMKFGKKEVRVEQEHDDIDEGEDEVELEITKLHSCRRPLIALIHPTRLEFFTTGPDAKLMIRSYTKEKSDQSGKYIDGIESPKIDEAQTTDKEKRKKQLEYGISMALHSCGDIAAIGTKFGYVHLFDIKQREHLTAIKSGESTVTCLHFTPDDCLIAGKDNGTVNVYDVGPFIPFSAQAVTSEQDKGQQYDDGLDEFADDFEGCNFSPYINSQSSAVSSMFSQITPSQQIQAQSVKPARSWSAMSTFLQSVKASPDGRIVATASLDGHIRIWDHKNSTNLPLCTISQDEDVNALEWKPIPKETTTSEGERPAKRCKTVHINNGTMTAAAQSAKTASMFVTAGVDGKVRWYRMAGGGDGNDTFMI